MGVKIDTPAILELSFTPRVLFLGGIPVSRTARRGRASVAAVWYFSLDPRKVDPYAAPTSMPLDVWPRSGQTVPRESAESATRVRMVRTDRVAPRVGSRASWASLEVLCDAICCSASRTNASSGPLAFAKSERN